MPRVIDAEARISALDATGDTFARIAQKVESLGKAMRSLSGVATSGIGAVNATVGKLQSATHTLAPVAGTAAAYQGMRGVRGIIHETVKATAEGAHERVRMDVAGISEEDIRHGEEISAQLSEKYKALSQTTILHALRNMQSIVGTYEEAAHLLEPILKLRVTAMGAHPERAAELAEDFDKLVKGMEIKGVTMDPEKFTSYMQGMAKAINVFGDTLRPTDFYEMFKYGRQATMGLSEEFMLKTAPTLAQELGGMSAGQAISSFHQAIVGGRIKQQSVKEMEELGLINADKVVRTSTGSIKGLQQGGVKGWELAARDPYAWVNQVLLPAFAAKGITDPEEIQAKISTIFQQRTAAQLATIFALQQGRIEKDWKLVEKAKGLEAADTFIAKDPFIAWTGVTEQFKNLLQVAGGPMAPAAAAGLNAIASGLSALANAAKDHPLLAAAGLTGATAATAAAAGAASMFTLKAIGAAVRGGAAAAPAADLSGAAAIKVLQSTLPQMAPAAAVPYAGLVGPIAAAIVGAQALREATYPFAGMTIPERLEAQGGGSMQRMYRRRFEEERQEQGYGPSFIANRGTGPISLEDIRGALGSNLKAVVDGPVTAEVKGNADLNVKVEVAPTPDFITRIESAVSNAINVFRGGSTGSPGRSMPEAGPMP